MNRTRRITIRFSPDEYEIVMGKAKSAHLSMSEYIRKTSLDKPIVVVDSLRETVAVLRKIGGNLNQLTRLCNEGRITCLELHGVRKGVSDLWQSLNALTQKAR